MDHWVIGKQKRELVRRGTKAVVREAPFCALLAFLADKEKIGDRNVVGNEKLR